MLLRLYKMRRAEGRLYKRETHYESVSTRTAKVQAEGCTGVINYENFV